MSVARQKEKEEDREKKKGNRERQCVQWFITNSVEG